MGRAPNPKQLAAINARSAAEAKAEASFDFVPAGAAAAPVATLPSSASAASASAETKRPAEAVLVRRAAVVLSRALSAVSDGEDEPEDFALKPVLSLLATELKNNSNKLAKWTLQAMLAGADLMSSCLSVMPILLQFVQSERLSLESGAVASQNHRSGRVVEVCARGRVPRV